MTNEEKKKVESGPGSIQRQAEGSSDEESKTLRKKIEACDRKEASLYAQRGYGGYIDTDELEEIRQQKTSAKIKLNAKGIRL